MTTEREGSGLIQSWLDGTYEAERDAQPFLDRMLRDVPATPQRRRRWWHLPTLRRSSAPPTANQTTDYQLTSIPAMNGHSPTVLGRTQSMFSPVKAITAGALVFAIGGVLLIAQPFGQQEASVPAAETAEVIEPVEFTLVLGTSNRPGEGATCEVVDGVNHCLDARLPVAIIEASDPRLAGQFTLSLNQIQYPEHPWFTTATTRIFNEGGVWQGSSTMTESVVLVGEGGYEGLYAWLDVSDGDVVNGVIYPTAPLEPTDLSPVATD